MARDVKPFFVPGPDAVRASGWERWVDGDWEPLGEYVDDWDYRTRLRVRCNLSVDVEAVRATTGLDDGSPLAWSVGWRATDTGLLGSTTVLDVRDDIMPVEFEVAPERAGASVVLTRRLILRRDRMQANAGEARWAGSVLWAADETLVRLTGRGAAFPTDIASFDDLGVAAGASWYLELPITGDVPAMGSLLLLINSADTDLVEAVSKSTRRQSDTQKLLVAEMEEGVIAQMVRWALDRWDGLDDLEADSVGATARTLTTRVLPDPESWTGTEVDPMALQAAVVSGARGIGFGRSLR